MKELRKDIRNKTVGSLYLFTGSETYLLKTYENAIIKAYLPNFAEMNLTVLSGKNVLPDKISDAAETLPFMSDKRIVIVKDSELFAAGRKNDSDAIAGYISNYENNETILIFIEEKVDKRGKAYKAIKGRGKIVAFDPLSENELIAWHSNVLRDNGLSMPSKDAIYLIRICGGDMDTILRETEKLCSYKNSGIINKQDIDAICTKTKEAIVFDLIDAISAKDLSAALTIYNQLLAMKETPIGILAMVSRSFRLILKCALLKQKGYNELSISKALNERPYSIKMCLSQARNFTQETLEKAVVDAAEWDTRIKSGLANGETAVEMLIIKSLSNTNKDKPQPTYNGAELL